MLTVGVAYQLDEGLAALAEGLREPWDVDHQRDADDEIPIRLLLPLPVLAQMIAVISLFFRETFVTSRHATGKQQAGIARVSMLALEEGEGGGLD